MAAAAVVLSMTLACGLDEAIFQSAHSSTITFANHLVVEFHEKHGNLPEYFDQVLEDSDHNLEDPRVKRVHYCKTGSETYVLWLVEAEIGNLKEIRGTAEEPKDGDVFGRYDVYRGLIESSWR